MEEEKQLGICGNGGMFSQSSLSSESGKQMDPAKVLGMLLPWAGKRVSRPFPSAEARPVPSCPGSCVSGLSEPPGQVPSLEQAGNRHEELRAGPAPAPAAGVCLHRVIWFQSSEILKLSTGTSSILNAFRTGWTNPARRTVSSWAAAVGLAPPPLLAHKSRSRHGWGLRDLGPSASAKLLHEQGPPSSWAPVSASIQRRVNSREHDCVGSNADATPHFTLRLWPGYCTSGASISSSMKWK